MRKTILYLVILGLLGFAVYYFLFDNQENAFSLEEAGFNIKDTGNIGKIFIASSVGETVLSERTDSGWVVNKKYKVLPSTINMLLTTLYQQQPLYPVTQRAYENAVKNLTTDGIKVEVYGRDGKKMRVFYVGGVAVNNTGTNMLMDGAKKPYVVQIAGFTGYLTPRYPTELRYWRDRTIVNLPPEEVKSVTVQYAEKPINSFTLTREAAGITIKGDTNITKYKEKYNSRRANVYMKYFSGVNCEGYLNGLEDMDTTLKTTPLYSVVDVEGMHGQHQHMDVYYVPINKRSKNLDVSDPDVPDNYDADRLYAVINNKQDTVLIQRFVFKNIFHRAYEFFQSDVEQTVTPELKPKNVVLKKNQ